jgi:CDP-diacylglycerol--serine O-phosphatidyltransferase
MTEADQFPDDRQSRSRRQRVFAVLPTLLTLGNAVCGFGAITITARVGPENFSGSDLFLAAQLIFLAMLFDALDGSAARLTKQTSDFGAQLDSLCDAVSFGVAPAFLMLKLTHPDHLLMNTIARPPFHYPTRMLWGIAVLFMVCAILRLARFNVESDDDDSHEAFSGLPSPAAAGVVAAFPIGVHGIKSLLTRNAALWAEDFSNGLLPWIFVALPLITLGAAVLMVSRIRYPHVLNQMVRGQKNRLHVLQIVFLLILAFIVREMAVPVLFCWFAFAPPCQSLYRRFEQWRLGRLSPG